MAKEVEVPIAYCVKCESNVPVFIGDFDHGGESFKAVICPICESVLNKEGDIEIDYYLVDDIEDIAQFRGEIIE